MTSTVRERIPSPVMSDLSVFEVLQCHTKSKHYDYDSPIICHLFQAKYFKRFSVRLKAIMLTATNDKFKSIYRNVTGVL